MDFLCPVHGLIPFDQVEYNEDIQVIEVYTITDMEEDDNGVVYMGVTEKGGMGNKLNESYFDHIGCGHRVEPQSQMWSVEYE